MNEQQLLRAIGAADPEHLEKSEQTPKRRRRPWAGWAVAACLCLVVGAVFRLVLGGAKGGREASRRAWPMFIKQSFYSLARLRYGSAVYH